MSRDPLDELFGPLEPDDADETPTTADETPTSTSDWASLLAPADPVAAAPVAAPPVAAAPVAAPPIAAAPIPAVTNSAPWPAVSAPAPVPAPVSAPVSAPVRQYRDELPTAPVPAARKRPAAALPWIIVGGIVVLALIGSIIFISTINGSGDAKPETTTESPEVSVDPETPATDPTEDAPEETTTPTPEATKPPKVDVGPTISMPISFVGITVEASQKLEPNGWFVPQSTTNRVTWESNLMNSFPDSCAAMRSPVTQSPWGIEQDAAGKWIVVRPAGTCEAAPDLYNQVWGLMQAIADSAKPLEG